MTNQAGPQGPTLTIRRTTSAEAEGQKTEQLIRDAHELLTCWGVEMSHNRVVRLVRRYEREVVGFTFSDYLANAVDVVSTSPTGSRSARPRRGRRTGRHADPTAWLAVHKVMKERGQR